jgi:hypothetical protein
MAWRVFSPETRRCTVRCHLATMAMRSQTLGGFARPLLAYSEEPEQRGLSAASRTRRAVEALLG